MKNKYLILVLLIMLFSITTVSATNQTDNLQTPDDANPLKSNITVSGNSFNDIQNTINQASPNDTLKLSGTYKSSGKVITLSKSLVFDGEMNATLDANHLSGIFYINKDLNLTFNNIKFINAKDSAILTEDNVEDGVHKSKVVLNNCTFINNYGEENGAVYVYECNVNNSVFINNHALGLIEDYPSSWGGAIQATFCSVSDSLFTNNSALSNGGAILAENAVVVGCNFINNSAGWEGGALEISDGIIRDSNFTNNKADREGGAVYGYEIDVFDCIFNNNHVNYRAGALYAGRLSVHDSNFTNNDAIYAGAIFTTNLISNNCSFVNNHEGAIISCRITFDYKIAYSSIVSLDNSLNPINLINIDAKSYKTSYFSGEKMTMNFSTSENNKPARLLEFVIVATKGKNTNYLYLNTNSKGIWTYDFSKWDAGTYKVKIISGSSEDEAFTCPFTSKTFSVTVTKSKPVVKAPKVTNKYKKSKYFKVTLKHKTTKNPFKSVKIKLKIFTGKKSKTYTVKTDKNGVAKYKTNKLKKGKHKVIITSASKNFSISQKSLIRIK